jgi:GT2 family glycosyltransferase
MTPPRLSIVIVTYNSRRDVDGCLGSVSSAPPAVRHEIVLVDNASPDGTADHVRRHWPGIRVIDAVSNRGFAAANNQGIRQTTGELVLLLNPDTIVRAGAIDELVARLDAAPHAAVAGPRIVDRDGRAELSFGRMLSPLAELRQKVLVTGNDRGSWPFVQWVDRATRLARAVDWVSGACLLIRRMDLEAAGLLDERYFMYIEDVDLCTAVRARGREVRFEPSSEIVHLRGRSAQSAPRAASAAYRRSQLAYYEKHRPRWAPLLKLYIRMTRGRCDPARS